MFYSSVQYEVVFNATESLSEYQHHLKFLSITMGPLQVLQRVYTNLFFGENDILNVLM